MTSQADLEEIRSLLLKLNQKVDGLNKLVEERLIGYEEPTSDDIKAIREYENAKKKGKIALISLEEVAKGT